MREIILESLWKGIKVSLIFLVFLNGIYVFYSVLKNETLRLLFSGVIILAFSYFVLKKSLKNLTNFPDLNFENPSRRRGGELEKLVKKVEFALKGYSLSQERLGKRIEKIFEEKAQLLEGEVT